MNYYGAKDLAAAFRTVRKNTVVIAGEIGDEHYGFRATSETRTIAQTLVHIAMGTNVAEQIHAVEKRTTLEGFDFPRFMSGLIAEEQTPRSKAQIVALLSENGDRFGQWLEGLQEDFLAQRVTMPAGMSPASRTRFEMLLGVKEHEMHHRGQLMLLERLVGLVPHLTREMLARMSAMQAAKA
ncbi:MAG: DinB family protein [Acidobacteriota bacterium]|nr:DinB family protein [Acidobacteriota bacterium]